MYVINVDESKCTGCQECIQNCPADYLGLSDAGVAQAIGDDCLGCESCVAICPTEAITLQEY